MAIWVPSETLQLCIKTNVYLSIFDSFYNKKMFPRPSLSELNEAWFRFSAKQGHGDHSPERKLLIPQYYSSCVLDTESCICRVTAAQGLTGDLWASVFVKWNKAVYDRGGGAWEPGSPDAMYCSSPRGHHDPEVMSQVSPARHDPE